MKPEILAPAGDTPSALAALAAGADAIYLGLKHFSARMQAENFSTTDLSRLVELANKQDARIYVAMNTLLKPGDMDSAYNLAARLARHVQPHALIVQDLGMVELARQAGFEGGIFLSTLANITHPAGLQSALKAGAQRVILPRELSIDEIRAMGEACPEGLDLECFVHGALCYCVSGRCYWSSYMGGKSGLRGRCVQPCRRVYRQGGTAVPPPPREDDKPRYADSKGRPQDRGRQDRARQERPRSTGKLHSGRYFSCLDLSLDVLAKTLLDIPHLTSWKIEGRKKGPHYVYHVVTAYRMLRDNPGDPQVRKMAEDILGMALGRPSTHARFLPQRTSTPTAPNDQTSSGLLVGKVALTPDEQPFIKPYIELLAQDYLRVGVEDQTWHATLPVTRRTPKAGTLPLRLPKHKTPKAGTPVYLIDRRQPELMDLLKQWQARLEACKGHPSSAVHGAPTLPPAIKPRKRPDMFLRSAIPQGRETRSVKHQLMALWLSPKTQEISRTIVSRMAWWLPPVIWPDEEAGMRRLVHMMLRNGATHFVCNAPWQMEFFLDHDNREELDILAGPFCNIANAAHLALLERMGFAGAFVSPELPAEDMLALPAQSPLPLGFVLDGFWPVGIARFDLLGIKPNEPFASPKGEVFWARNYGGNVWIYPGWPLDFTEKRAELEKAGYSFFVHVHENPPHNLPEVRRHGLFNWDEELL